MELFPGWLKSVQVIPFLALFRDLCIFCWLYGLMNGCYFVAARLDVSRARILVVIQRPNQIKGNCYEGSRGGVYQDIKTEPGAPEERWISQFRSRTTLGALHHLGNYLLPPTMVRKRRLFSLLTWAAFCHQTHPGGFWQVEHAAELSISG